MNERIQLSTPHMTGREMKYIQEAFDTNWIAPIGPNITGFEQDLCQFTGSRYALALSSGTAAIHLALHILGVGKGDIVLCQSLTFIATANPILYLGANPAFIDSEPTTWNMCPDTLETAIKHYLALGKKPKAVVVVHLYGMPAQLKEIILVCAKYDIPLVEDAAEALGSTYFGQNVGVFGYAGILSFNGNKIITTSGGGALLCQRPDYLEKARFLASQAKDNASHYEHSETGYNHQLSNVCAGIGRGQMEVLKDLVEKRRSIFDLYRSRLKDIPGVSFQEEQIGFFSNRWLTVVVFDPKESEIRPETLRLALEKSNIETRHVWKPMHLQPIFKNTPYFGGNVAETLFETGLCLPSGSNLPPESIQVVSEKISELCEK
ncbi:DegT/DnrJ/EryC1/StrS family aminotransferase [Dyadobacter pollutisoli]|uniref:GDP-perosamine synthase n=1 Tax=Dyadobacter pollutisoli TaxID=2910158 RepID=A0A9E8N6F4_9BACT|nr:DegT/DnrJ/EryC1/StrS family aminotransferase [Dyadobacter pollutisoli]WAC10705.1 DegT/DnrJ/EryC1/StrS family aminotransferase [Dyadobacter pollutisoli]